MQKDSLLEIIGCDAIHMCAKLLPDLKGVHAISLVRFKQPPTVQSRAHLNSGELAIAKEAAQSRKNNWFSYLELVLELAAKADFISEGLLNAAGYHCPHNSERIRMNLEELQSIQNWPQESKGCHAQQLALCSKVHTYNESELHIPMVDFHVEKTTMGFELVKNICKRIFGNHFVVLSTNRSFHGISFVLKSKDEFMRILANSLLYAPIVDNAYVAHQLMEQEATLRIGSKLEDNNVPRVVAASNDNSIYAISNINEINSNIIESSY